MMVNEQHVRVSIRDFNVRELSKGFGICHLSTVGQARQEARR